MAGYAYRNPQTTRVSRRGSLVGGLALDRPELHLQIPSSSFSSASASSRPTSSASAVPPSSSSVLYVPSSYNTPSSPSIFSNQVTAKISELLETPAARRAFGVLGNLIHRINYVHIFCLAWLTLIWFGERTYPYNSIQKCSWNQWENWTEAQQPARVALITDPQLVDAHTYSGRNWILQGITEYMTDLYLRRNWVYINEILDSDANAFVGDLFDGGREWEDRQWKQEFKRWNRIYTKPAYKKTIMSLPGNHDIGFGNTLVYSAWQRFGMYFGDPSSTHIIGNHTLVLLDTISMMNTENSTIFQPPLDFIDSYTSGETFEKYPRILLTHVPLFRDPSLSCGPHRESKRPLPFVRGHQYQTMISPETSDFILKSLRPTAVFSGDDHDACYVKHNFTTDFTDGSKLQENAEEYTIKSASMAMGVAHPAIQLLSLHNDISRANSEQEKTFQTKLCYMPNPFYAIILYALFAVFSLTVILIVNFLPSLFPPLLRDILSKRQSSSHSNLILSSPMVSLGHAPLLPTYETEEAGDEDDSKKKSSFRLDSAGGRKRPYDNTLWRAKQMIRNKNNWGLIAKDVAIIVICAMTFFLILSKTIYWT